MSNPIIPYIESSAGIQKGKQINNSFGLPSGLTDSIISSRYDNFPPWTDGDYTNSRPTLIDVEKKDYVSCSCEAPLFFNIERCTSFAHWSDTILPIISLAGKILKQNEKINEIKEIKFLKPILNNVNIFIAEEWHEDENFKKEKASIIGKLSTSGGRILNFIVIQRNNDPIKDFRKANTIAEKIDDIKNISEIQTWIWWVKIQDDNIENIRKILEKNIVLSHSVLVEFISSTLSYIFHKNLKNEKKEGKIYGVKYLSKIQNLPTKDNILDLLSKWIEIKYIQSKSISPDVIFYMFEIKTPSDQIINVTISYNRIFK